MGAGPVSRGPAAAREGTPDRGLRADLMVVCDYDSLAELTDNDRRILAKGANGTDVLDAALCLFGVFDRSPRRGTIRHKAQPPRSIQELVRARVPEPLRAVTIAYMNAYSQSISKR